MYGLNFMFGVSALALFPFANSIRYCLAEKSRQGETMVQVGSIWSNNLPSIHVCSICYPLMQLIQTID
jgi:hypothetical protein